MNSVRFNSGASRHTVVITRVTETLWHAVEAGRVVGRGEASRRPDGRLFLSADTWQDAVFDRLANAMLTALPKPLYTVVDEADVDLTANWRRAGLTIRRREWEYLVPTDPDVTGLGSVPPPAGVTIIALGAAEEGPLRALDRAIRDEVPVWADMPAEVVANPLPDPAKYAVAAAGDEYVGLVRVAALPRQPRIGLIAVRAGHRRRGIARALLADVLRALHHRGIARALLADVLRALHHRGVPTATAEVTESNLAATALFDGAGAHRASSNLELVFA